MWRRLALYGAGKEGNEVMRQIADDVDMRLGPAHPLGKAAFQDTVKRRKMSQSLSAHLLVEVQSLERMVAEGIECQPTNEGYSWHGLHNRTREQISFTHILARRRSPRRVARWRTARE